MVAVECEGGIYTRQAHGSISGILRDIEKYNAATSLGWRVFRVTRRMLEEDPEGVIRMILEALNEIG
jgi:very-short-patch-repair endonuclease